jgi:hypothetical protein
MKPSHTESRSGIALIIVLGFLALLTLMAISFSIEMRTERLTSKVYMDAGDARNYIDIALARAMADIDDNLTSGDLNAPDWTYIVSSGSSGVSEQLYDGEALDYVPRFDAGTPGSAVFEHIPNPSGGGDPVGRYAYLVVNQTGLLDVNEVGKPGVSRDSGADPGEIRITPEQNPEIEPDWNAFVNALPGTWRRIETINELGAITGTNFNEEVSSIGLFSRSLPELDPEGNPKYQLTDAADLIANTTGVIARLISSGLDTAEAGQVFTNLVDFLDQDYLPYGGLDTYCGEPVPLINEVVVSNHVIITGLGTGSTSVTHQLYVQFEVWNPFQVAASFRFDYHPAGITIPPLPISPDLDLSAVTPTRTPAEGSSIIIGPDEFSLIEYRYELTRINPVITPNLGGSVAVRVQLGGTASILHDGEGGQPVNRVNFGALGLSPFSLLVSGVTSGGGMDFSRAMNGLDVDDPRRNYITPLASGVNGEGWYTTGASVSPGAINPRALQLAALAGEGDLSNLPALYVRNEPFDDNSPPGGVAELGYIGLGDRWRSVALYDHPDGTFDMNPVLDYFVTGPTNGVRRGLVSMNAVNENALASVFFDAPVNTRPGTIAIERLTHARAEEIAADLYGADGSITNLAFIGTMDSVLSQGQQTDDLHEAVIRNSIGLLTVRQNLFAVIMEAQTLGEQPPDGGAQPVLGVARALAYVWRDPVAGSGGLRPMYVRHFMYLDENF